MATGAAAADPAAASAADADADANASFADFDRGLLAGAGSNTSDLSRFEHGNPVLPGVYNLDVYINNTWVGRTDVRFVAASPQTSATACVTRKLLDQLGLRPAKLSKTIQVRLQNPAECVDIGEVISGSTMTLDMSTLRLDTSVPQAYMGQAPRDYVSPEYWEKGVPAALLNYNFNNYQSSSHGLNQTSTYLGLNAGLNLGLWHLRQNATVTWQSGTAGAPARREWHNIDAYVQRDLPSMRSLLTIGDSYTDGSVFDSYGLRGVQLATDDRMLPNSLRGYAPIIQGVANTNAKVTVRQNGVQIYQTTVAPGPFTIKDLYPTGYGGNLDVTVTEADGHERSFSVPYASVAQLLRPGISRYDIAIGQLRNVSLMHKPGVVQASIQHGFSNFFTGYAGLVGSQGYAAALLGGAINTRYGALALDITQADTRIPGYKAQDGQSVRLTYSKIIPSTQTSLSVAAYRYSTSGYLSLGDAAIARDYARRGLDALQYIPPTTVPMIDGLPAASLLTPAQQAALSGNTFTNTFVAGAGLQRRRNNFTLTLSQRLGQSAGSLYANGSISDYWNSSGTDTQFQVGYNNSFRRLSYNLSATRTRDAFGRYENEYMLSFNLPLGHSAHAPTFSLNVNRSDSGNSQDQAMVSGTLGANSQFNYGATVTHGSDGNGNAGALNAGYRSPYAIYNASYGAGHGYSQSSLGVSGAIVAHPGGITFGQPIGETVAIVHVPDAAGASINSAPGVSVGRGGYALVPYLTPYQLNTIQIDPQGLPLSVQMDATSAQVAPYAGAVVMLDFKTRSGHSLIAHIQREDGTSLPFGTDVLDAHGQAVGAVGQGGLALLRVASKSGQLGAQWQGSDGATHECSFAYAVPAPSPSEHGQPFIDTTCAASNQAAPQPRGGQ